MRGMLPRAVVGAAVAALVLTGAAVAATLGVTSQLLTSWTAASTVPISTCTLTASADSFVEEDDASDNNGSAATLEVQSYQTTDLLLFTTSRDRRSFVKFDIGSCSIPAGASLQSSNLSVFLSTAPSLSRTWNIGRVTGSWTEGGVTWSNQPTATGSTSVTTGTTSNVTLQASVMSDVQAFLSGTANNGWRFSDSAENSATQRRGVFNSREAGSNRPTLVIRYYP